MQYGKGHEVLLKLLAGSPLPASWFYKGVLSESNRQARTGKLTIEIVSHCWGYSRLLSYQLDSLIRRPINNAHVIMTVFHSAEDTMTRELLALAASHSAPNVEWNWQPLPKKQLFRRSIGRNKAALSSTADWLWFTDCDMTFQNGCIDSLNKALQGRKDALVFPEIEYRTLAYGKQDLVNQNALDKVELLQAPIDDFQPYRISRATGPLQITHGDVARYNGYCSDVPYYQKPAAQFQKATEDRVFRWLLSTRGTPVSFNGACRIQHVEKGRYTNKGSKTRLRKLLRQLQYKLRHLGK